MVGGGAVLTLMLHEGMRKVPFQQCPLNDGKWIQCHEMIMPFTAYGIRAVC